MNNMYVYPKANGRENSQNMNGVTWWKTDLSKAVYH